MNIVSIIFFSFWGVLGKRTLNPEVLKCHEDRITLDTYVQQGKTMDNKFYIYVKTLTSLAKLGPGGGGPLATQKRSASPKRVPLLHYFTTEAV